MTYINIRAILSFTLTLLICVCANAHITVGAERYDQYMPLLKGKQVALYTNHTGLAEGRHTLDVLLDNGINVTKVFAPEHGFRGTADAGEHVKSSTDPFTGTPIVSLYGSTKRPTAAMMDDVDVIVVDIQDVGLRFYTYYITMIDLMNAAADHGKEVMILDRPNPNGMSVDGPILDMRLKSGVGALPIPVLHGLTLGELAHMANGEGWLKDGRKVPLTVIRCDGYTHQSRYRLPVAPSPNLPTMLSVYLYPSLCYFEATPASVGRGTDKPFLIYGHPDMRGGDFTFTPTSRPGARKPPLLNRKCRGYDLSGISEDDAISQGLNLEYIINARRQMGNKPGFIGPFFDKLIGNSSVRQMIEQGHSADEIKRTWADDVQRFRQQRKPYLLYPE
ncbi:MAG: DUF1343 domain-containing protein [Pseudoflavonifractor sp.]|nr:DUF1343 domain-containing protein [Pseudoflavonifractor sp.]